MRVPLHRYLEGVGVKVYSLVAAVPYTPIDIDLGHLSRGEWNTLTDRFRVWYMPGEDGKDDTRLCYVMIRKLDNDSQVLTYTHIMVNMNGHRSRQKPNFIVGVLSNDDIRARTTLNAILEIPPVFHLRSELRTIEKRWRSDQDAVFRFAANVHSAMARVYSGSGNEVHEIKFELPPGLAEQLRLNMGTWWQYPNGK